MSNAQISDIKNKAKQNKNKSSSSSSSYSSSSSSSSDNDGCGCSNVGLIFDLLHILFESSGSEENNDVTFYPKYDLGLKKYETQKQHEQNSKNNTNTQVNEYQGVALTQLTDSINKNIVNNAIEQENTVIPNTTINKHNKIEKTNNASNLYTQKPDSVSLDVRALFAPGLHYSKNKNCTYINFLPGLRLNFNILSVDFRFNALTEYTDGFPNSFSSLELLLLFNIYASEKFALTLGTGLQNERYLKSTFSEHYIGFEFLLANKADYINFDTRFSMDYSTSAFPFFEVGINYKKRIAALKKVNMYISMGGIYQNYYQSNDIWALQAGIIINVY
ncbi:MAG: hypothetical protein B6I20_07615 [Bacteroidetes bacterium 4572_117]|nr:MAG: hypothetical protein B6I20_07615 [Bacteroidetes bacterium 4572_117]